MHVSVIPALCDHVARHLAVVQHAGLRSLCDAPHKSSSASGCPGGGTTAYAWCRRCRSSGRRASHPGAGHCMLRHSVAGHCIRSPVIASGFAPHIFMQGLAHDVLLAGSHSSPSMPQHQPCDLRLRYNASSSSQPHRRSMAATDERVNAEHLCADTFEMIPCQAQCDVHVC